MKAILACDRNMLMGLNGGLPFSCTGDMNHFKETTKGHIVVMGWNTWLSLGEKPLDDRVNIIVKNMGFSHSWGDNKDIHFVNYNNTFNTFLLIFEKIKDYENKQIFCIGGAKTFESLREHIDEVILSVIDTVTPVFPNDERVYLPCLKEFMLHSTEKREGFEVNRYVKL